MAEPKTYRPVHHRRHNIVENVRYNPLTGTEEEYTRTHERGAEKDTEYSKKTDVMLSHPRGKTRFYTGPSCHNDIYAVGLVYDIDKTDSKKPLKYASFDFMNTNARNWQKPVSGVNYNYWGETKFRSNTLDEIRSHSKNDWSMTALMMCVSKASVSAICVSIDYLCNRINAIHKQQMTLQRLGKNLPIILLPKQNKPDSRLQIYTASAQLKDILYVFERTASTSGALPAKRFVSQIDIKIIMKEAMIRTPTEVTSEMKNALFKMFIAARDSEGLALLNINTDQFFSDQENALLNEENACVEKVYQDTFAFYFSVIIDMQKIFRSEILREEMQKHTVMMKYHNSSIELMTLPHKEMQARKTIFDEEMAAIKSIQFNMLQQINVLKEKEKNEKSTTDKLHIVDDLFFLIESTEAGSPVKHRISIIKNGTRIAGVVMYIDKDKEFYCKIRANIGNLNGLKKVLENQGGYTPSEMLKEIIAYEKPAMQFSNSDASCFGRFGTLNSQANQRASSVVSHHMTCQKF